MVFSTPSPPDGVKRLGEAPLLPVAYAPPLSLGIDPVLDWPPAASRRVSTRGRKKTRRNAASFLLELLVTFFQHLVSDVRATSLAEITKSAVRSLERLSAAAKSGNKTSCAIAQHCDARSACESQPLGRQQLKERLSAMTVAYSKLVKSSSAANTTK
jgi:hypothetical protein